MGILTKMLGTKTFLLLALSVLGYSMPQPELRIIIHLHQDNFQPGPVQPRGPRGYEGGLDHPARQPRGTRRYGYGSLYENGSDYSDDDVAADDLGVIDNAAVDEFANDKAVADTESAEAMDGGQGSDYCGSDYSQGSDYCGKRN